MEESRNTFVQAQFGLFAVCTAASGEEGPAARCPCAERYIAVIVQRGPVRSRSIPVCPPGSTARGRFEAGPNGAVSLSAPLTDVRAGLLPGSEAGQRAPLPATEPARAGRE